MFTFRGGYVAAADIGRNDGVGGSSAVDISKY